MRHPSHFQGTDKTKKPDVYYIHIFYQKNQLFLIDIEMHKT